MKCLKHFLPAFFLFNISITTVFAAQSNGFGFGPQKQPESAMLKVSSKNVRIHRPEQNRNALTQPSSQDSSEIVKSFLLSQNLQFNTHSQLNTTAEYVNRRTRTTHVKMTQEVNGLTVHGVYVKAALNRSGELVHVIENITAPANARVKPSNITPEEALRRTLRQHYPGQSLISSPSFTENNTTSFVKDRLFYSEPKATRVAIPMLDGTLEEGFLVETWDKRNMLRHTLVNRFGRILNVELRTNFDSYNIFPDSPDNTSQTVVSGPGAGNAESPAGWIFTDTTTGNNVDAYLDRDANGVPDTNGRPISVDQNFLSVADLTLDPTTAENQNVALQNLFYFNNLIHDTLYRHGFTEAAGNFQEDNFGLGGLGGDSVNAEAQDGSGFNNANFATPSDGSNPRMQMFLWTSASPNRDSDLDSDVIWHEYGHGLTWRMIGSMSGPLAGAIGEGMSDTLAIIINEDDVVGEWSFNNPGGIRSFPYSGYPRTYGDLTGSSVHGDGEIYAATMWRLWELWQANGLSKDLLLDYIVAGMNFTPARPAYEDMRDGILAAITDTDHQCLVWEAFAQFGIGVGAVGTESPVSVTESFFLPGLCEEDDTIPPSQVVDLSLESIDARSATLSWTATGDDGTVGNALSYDLRYSLAPITEENFGSAIQVTGLPLPNPPGTLETAGVTGLSPNTTYYFAVRVLDNVNNVSPVSNVVSDTTQPLVTVFNDDLENGADNWLITGTVDPSTGLPLWHTTSHRFSSPSTAFYYGIDGVLNYDTGSINSGQITSIPISLEGITEPSLVFNHYLRTENLSPFDAASIDVSADGGLTWTQVFLTSLSTTGTDMVEQVIDLSAFDGQIIQIRFGFDTVDSAINNFEGWVIDDIRIDGTPIFGDLPPVANAGGPYNNALGQPTLFSGSGSFDPEGQALSYSWDFGDGTSGVGETPSHIYSAVGTYTVTLVVDDGTQPSLPVTTTVEIGLPVANPGGPYSGGVTQPINFDGTQSVGLSGNPLNFSWDFGDGNTGTGAAPSHAYQSSGEYTVTLVVDDGFAPSEPVTTLVDVQLPFADPGAPYDAIVGEPITLNGSGSVGTSGNPLTYTWDFGDGSTGVGVNPTHTYAEPGVYDITLTVEDGFLPDTGDTFVIVTQTPVANPGGPYSGVVGSPVSFDGSASVASLPGEQLGYVWDFGDGSTGVGVTPAHTYAAPGNYTVTLTVDDGFGLSEPAITNAVIAAVPNIAPVIDSVSATPSSILDTETTQLAVAATDPDNGPGVLTYNWIVPTGMGSVDDSSSSTPIFTPADVSTSQDVTITVEVSDGLETVSSSIVVTVQDDSEPTQPSLLNANFDDGSIAGWTVVDQGAVQGPSNWSVVNGSLVQSSNVYSSPLDPAELGKLGTYLTYDAGSAWADYRASFTLNSSDNDSIGFMFRVQNSDNYYRFSWDQQRSFRRLVKRVDGVTTLLASDNVPYAQNTTYNVEVMAAGSVIEVSINGELVLQAIDSDLNSGSVAFYSWANNGNTFDDLTVESLAGGNLPPIISSVTATPASIVDTETSQLFVAATDAEGVALEYNWIVPVGMGSLDDANSPTPVFTPADVTDLQSVTITVEVSDGEATVSDTVVVTVRDESAAPLLLNANFDDGSIEGWSIVDQGTVQGPSNWSAASGSLVQSSNLYSSPLDPAELGKLGTYLVYDSGSEWTDYRASFTLSSSDNDSIGFMFRVQDSDNYYRFSWDQQRNFRRLVKRVDGVTTLLASDSVPYSQNTTYNVEVLVSGNQIEVSIDGELVLQATDDDLSSGSVAFYSWANNGNTFDDLRVESP